MSKLVSLVEGVTSESDYSKFVRQCCSIIFLCVHLPSPCHSFKSWHSSSIAVLQKDEAAENSLMALCIIPLHLSSTLSHFLYAALGGWGGEGEKVRGNKQENADGIWTHSSLIQLQHLEKKTAFTTHWSCSELWLFDQDNLFSLSALQYLAYHFMICTLAIVFHSWSQWWERSYFVLIWEIREMGVKMTQKREDVSFFPSLPDSRMK